MGKQATRQIATVSTDAKGCCTIRSCMGFKFTLISCSKMYPPQR
nr:MAG TPA: hypothetical protein [Caudoviricetes sp.]